MKSIKNNTDHPKCEQISQNTHQANHSKIIRAQRCHKHRCANTHSDRCSQCPCPFFHLFVAKTKSCVLHNPSFDRIRNRQNSNHTQNRQLKAYIRNRPGIDHQHTKHRKPQCCERVIFFIDQQSNNHQTMHQTGTGNRSGESCNSGKEKQQR